MAPQGRLAVSAKVPIVGFLGAAAQPLMARRDCRSDTSKLAVLESELDPFGGAWEEEA